MRAIMTRAELAEHKGNSHGRNFMKSDDGYDDMELAEKVGWSPVSSWGSEGWDLGDWPYVVISIRNRAGKLQMLSVCEGDHDYYTFDSAEDRDAALDYLFAWYALGNGILNGSREDLDNGTFDLDPKYRGAFSWTRCPA